MRGGPGSRPDAAVAAAAADLLSPSALSDESPRRSLSGGKQARQAGRAVEAQLTPPPDTRRMSVLMRASMPQEGGRGGRRPTSGPLRRSLGPGELAAARPPSADVTTADLTDEGADESESTPGLDQGAAPQGAAPGGGEDAAAEQPDEHAARSLHALMAALRGKDDGAANPLADTRETHPLSLKFRDKALNAACVPLRRRGDVGAI